MRITVFLLISLLCFTTCAETDKEIDVQTIQKYAAGFQIIKKESYTDIIILNPWQGAKTKFSYTVGGKDLNDLALRKTAIINKQLERVVCLSTTHVAFLDALGLTDRIVGVANGRFIYNEKVRDRINRGIIADIGSDSELDYEKIVSLEPDVILTYAIDEGFMMSYDRLMALDQKVIVISEYLEATPLGQSEWLKVYGVIFDKEKRADSIFSTIETQYLSITSDAHNGGKPKVFCNVPWKETWYMPGGKSFTARLIEDAGGEYLWDDDQSIGSLNLDFEIVLQKAADGDIWINTGNMTEADQLVATDPKLSAFKAYKTGHIFNPVKRMSEGGGNDFYESGSLRADIVLKDLYHIFSGDSAHELYYYKKL